MNASDTASAADEQQDHATPPPADEAPQQADEAPQSDYEAPQDQRGASDYRGDAPLYRPYQGRMAAGVAAGIGNYLGVDPTIVRIVLAVLTVVGGAGIPVYMAGWLLMPDEGAPQSLASEFIGSLQGRSY